MSNFGQRLRELRNEENLTQERLSKTFKISESAVGMYERNEREPSFELLNEIADHFEVSVDYLMGRTNIRKSNIQGLNIPDNEKQQFEAFISDPNNGSFFKDYLSAPEEKKDELLRFWRYIQESEKGRKPGDKQGE